MPIGNLRILTSHEEIHMLHYKDGYPLCWPMARDGNFVGSHDETEVNCPECIDIIKEEPHAS
jgi:hypothetical protein